MTTFLYEPIISGHNPTFALWVSRVARANGEETVLYLPDGVLKSETMKLNVDLARAAGVEIRSAGVEGETYDDAGGRIGAEWYETQRETKPGDRLIVPTIDLMIRAGCVPTPSSDVQFDVIFHQPGSQLRLIPRWKLLRRGRTGFRRIGFARHRRRLMNSVSAHHTFFIDPHECLGPGRRRFMRHFGSLDPRLLPIGTLNTEGYEPAPSARHALGLPTEGPMLVVVGSINGGDAKGRNVLKLAWSEVRRTMPDATLAILGASYENKIIDKNQTAVDEGNGMIRLARVLSQSELLGVVSEASAVWSVRDRVEGMSSIADIALHFGRPVIVAGINVSSAWFTSGVGGERIDPGSVRSVARGILRAFARSRFAPTPPSTEFDGFAGAVDALAGRRHFTPDDLPLRLRTGGRVG